MTVLSAQTIRKRCQYWSGEPNPRGLIHPFVERGVVRGRSYGLSSCTYDCRISHNLLIPVRQSRLAVTMERFNLPHDVCGSVLDKSSWARVFLTAFNTHLDPGGEGYLTLELSNLGDECIDLQEGDPICQVKFELLDKPTELPYVGKYQNQEQKPTEAILEPDSEADDDRGN